MSKLKIAILILAAAALAGAGIYFIKYGNRAGSGASGGGDAPTLDLFGNPLGSSGGGARGSIVESDPTIGSGGSAVAPKTLKTYTHENPAFSFQHPESFSVSVFDDENGETVLVRGGSDKESFQIYITPFDEEGPITAERIREDIPDMVIESPKNVILGARGHPERSEGSDGGVPALAFLSGDVQNRTREVWFVRGPNLYQITAYPEFDGGLSEILKTWKFQ